MPNYVSNTLHIYGDTDVLNRIREELASEDRCIDFDKVIPMPPHSDTFFADGDISIEVQEQYGDNNWYDWSIANWGTKWNSLDSHIEGYADDGILTYVFDTAWTTPAPVAQAISSKYSVAVDLLYMGEEYGYNCGILEFDTQGNQIRSEHYDTDGEDFIERYFG